MDNGSTGIGKVLAIKFANMGRNVAISARREALIKEISDNNQNIYGFPLDVTNKQDVKKFLREIGNKFQNIDICFFQCTNPIKEKRRSRTN